MGETKQMVLGFVFNSDLTKVLLVNRQNAKQDWQNGKDNGLGGKVEGEETIGQAMEREFFEETGKDGQSGIKITEWRHFGSMGGVGWNVNLFAAKTNLIPDEFSLETVEGLVRWCDWDDLPEMIIENLSVLVPAARFSLTHDELEKIRFDFKNI